MQTSTIPNFTHDCDCCELVATFQRHGASHDVYLHRDEVGRTIIIRNGDDGPAYQSFPEPVARNIAQDFTGIWRIAVALIDGVG